MFRELFRKSGISLRAGDRKAGVLASGRSSELTHQSDCLAAGSSRQSILSHQFITYPYCVAAGQFSRPGRRIGNALLLHVASICFIRLFGNRTRILGRELHYHMIIMRIAWLSNRDQPGHFGVIVDSVFILGNRTHFWDLMIILGTQAGHIGTFKFDSMSTQAVSSKYKYTTAIFSL